MAVSFRDVPLRGAPASSSDWASLPEAVLAKIFEACPKVYTSGTPVNSQRWRHPTAVEMQRRSTKNTFRAACRAWHTAAGSVITDAVGSRCSIHCKKACPHRQVISSLHSVTPSLTSLTIRGTALRCKDFNQINRLPKLQHLTYKCAKEWYSEEEDRMESFDINTDCLFSAKDQASPFSNFTNLRSLHIEEEIPNISSPTELQPISLLTHLSRLELHCATVQRHSTRQRQNKRLPPMTEALYKSLATLPNLAVLAVDLPSKHVTKLKSLQQLKVTRCEREWAVPKVFTKLTSLSNLYVGSGRQGRRVSLTVMSNMPHLSTATFEFTANLYDWAFLYDIRGVTSLHLISCNLTNLTFYLLSEMTQLTSLTFKMSVPEKSGIDYGVLEGLTNLTNLSKLHGKFVSRYGSEDVHGLSSWFRSSPLSEIVPKDNAVLKLHQVPEDSDWMSDYDGDVSCISGDECQNCKSLLGDLAAFDIDEAAHMHLSDDEFFDAESGI